MKPVPIIAFLAVLMGCNAEKGSDWDDDKLLVLGVMYDHFNENFLTERSICMTSEQIRAKTGMDPARVNQSLKHLSEITGLERRIDNEECADGFKIDAFGRELVRTDRHDKAMLDWSRNTAMISAGVGAIAVLIGAVIGALALYYFGDRKLSLSKVSENKATDGPDSEGKNSHTPDDKQPI